jgi:hypothetical protein
VASGRDEQRATTGAQIDAHLALSPRKAGFHMPPGSSLYPQVNAGTVIARPEDLFGPRRC